MISTESVAGPGPAVAVERDVISSSSSTSDVRTDAPSRSAAAVGPQQHMAAATDPQQPAKSSRQGILALETAVDSLGAKDVAVTMPRADMNAHNRKSRSAGLAALPFQALTGLFSTGCHQHCRCTRTRWAVTLIALVIAGSVAVGVGVYYAKKPKTGVQMRASRCKSSCWQCTLV